MKLCRFQPLDFPVEELAVRGAAENKARPRAGVIENEEIFEIAADLQEILGTLAGIGVCESANFERTGEKWPAAEVQFLPPVVPSKIVCVGRNYREHAKELGNEAPKEPLIFLKPPSAIIAPEEPIVLPAISERVDYEGELAVIIARRCRSLSPSEDVFPYIAGYTCLNDVTARDLQKRDGQWTRGKGFDTFCPLGPVLQTNIDPAGAKVETFVNGISKQSACISEMIFPVDVIIRFVAQVMTLEPGDVIATGTPAGVGPLARGDVVEVSVSGIGTLRNGVVDGEDFRRSA
jgi:2-keto-4-pentenoate hydratase/2-oxohepta-3-ene-1,7-dioic acid hydratase in catechol pathway